MNKKNEITDSSYKESFFIDQYGYSFDKNKEIARGAQGVVYTTDKPNILVKVALCKNNQETAKTNITVENQIYDKVRTLPIMHGANIVVPLTILKSASGYTMELLGNMDSMETVFRGEAKVEVEEQSTWLANLYNSNSDFATIFDNYIATGGLRKRLKCLISAAATLSKLHMRGLVYSDLSLKNVFVSKDKDYNETWLIDSDNLDFIEDVIERGAGWKTPGFGAPELRKGYPNTIYSDAFSFAVVAFLILTDTHPFVGRKSRELDQEISNQINHPYHDIENIDILEELSLIADLPWVRDKDDESNTPEGPCDLYITNDLARLFQQTFGHDGKVNPLKRATLPEWVYMLEKAHDVVIRCHHCGMSYYAGTYPGKISDKCPWCDEKTERIKVSSYSMNGDEPMLVWEYSREITDQSISLPLRLVQESSIKSISDLLCKLKVTKRGFEINNWHKNYRSTIESKPYEIVSHYKYLTETKDILRLEVTHIESKKKYIIEIKVEL